MSSYELLKPKHAIAVLTFDRNPVWWSRKSGVGVVNRVVTLKWLCDGPVDTGHKDRGMTVPSLI